MPLMLYKDLLQFEPIESIIKLTDANEEDYAKRMLQSYVISERMADQLADEIIEHIQFERPLENKGLFIVGNYGTGKSHLMSVVSTLAERENSSQYITNEKVATKAKDIEGKFKVIRIEIGSVQTPLRDILIDAMETHLSDWGIDYKFPSDMKIANNKIALEEMMGLFNEKYSDQGLLLVIDELLDYLRGRKEQELTLDLGFLREIGETCSKTRLRFMAGIQEMLYGNARFSFVADSLQRISQRFVQISIIREDIAFVVSERLLKKTDEQKSYIREHLKQFTKLYHRLNEDIETYVNLFPIHPAYLTAFESVNLVEKRIALQTISAEIKKIINQPLNEHNPGLISYDSYWTYIESNATNKSDQHIRDVMSKHKTLYRAIDQSFPETKKRSYQQIAFRIINALAVDRLTTDDINDKVGLTPERLRDELFLLPPVNIEFLLEEDDPSDFLKTNVEAALKEIQKTVSYQYISSNESNGQYYLDLKKDIDVDSLIQAQAETIENNKLDRYYFDLLQQTLELDDNTYISNVKIWSYQLMWEANRIERKGYLFFGAPNERSTAQPERDFYLYMLPPYEKRSFKDEQKPDELFFEYDRSDSEFDRLLKLYAASQDLALDASSGTKKLYTSKIDTYRRQLVRRLTEQFNQTVQVIYKGKKAVIADTIPYMLNTVSVKKLIDASAESLLTDWFSKKYPDYPSFGRIYPGVTFENMRQYVFKALQMINGEPQKMGEELLSGFILLDSKNQFTTSHSGYIKWLQQLLDNKEHGQVINYDELIVTERIKGTEDIRYTKEFRIEPELFVVLLGAMLQTGKIEITIDGKTYDAMNYSEWMKLDINLQTGFSHIRKPSGLPTAAIKAVSDLYMIPLSNFEEETLQRFIRKLNEKTSEIINNILELNQKLRDGLQINGQSILPSREIQENQSILNKHKEFAETLQRYNTKAKLNNLRFSEEDIKKQEEALKVYAKLNELFSNVNQLQPLLHYLNLAQSAVSLDSEWNNQVEITVVELGQALRDGTNIDSIKRQLEQLKETYIQKYLLAHSKVRLTATENAQKQNLLNDQRLRDLESLAERISIYQSSQLNHWKQQLMNLIPCYEATEEQLQRNPLCNCKYRMNQEEHINKQTLTQADERLQTLYDHWIEELTKTLSSQDIQQNVSLLKDTQQKQIQDFVSSRKLQSPIEISFLQTVSELLSGITKVEFTLEDFENMMAHGSPLTIPEMKNQFEKLLREKIGNQSSQSIRVLLKK